MRLYAAFLCLCVAVADKVRYDGFTVFEVTPENLRQLKQLGRLQNSQKYDFQIPPRAVYKPVHVMVSPEEQPEFQEFLLKNGMKNRIHIENVQDLIDAEEKTLALRGRRMDWTSFHDIGTIYKWLGELESKYSFVKKVVLGRSYENRTIEGIEINFGEGLPGVVIETGIHAREWLGPAGTSWLVNEILKSANKSIFQEFNYLYFPLSNPDGYDYSWKQNRLWKKTRKPYKWMGLVTYGADPNRNFDAHWKSNNIPFSDVYEGPYPLSEKEIASVTKYLKRVAKKRRNDIYLSFQTYGCYLMYPWGWTKKAAPLNYFWHKTAVAAAEAWQKVDGSEVSVGESSRTLYVATGTSLDWYYLQFNCTFPFIYEMRGDYFIVDPEEIIIAGREHLASLKQILIEYKDLNINLEEKFGK